MRNLPPRHYRVYRANDGQDLGIVHSDYYNLILMRNIFIVTINLAHTLSNALIGFKMIEAVHCIKDPQCII